MIFHPRANGLTTNNMREVSVNRPFQGKQGTFVTIHQNKLDLNAKNNSCSAVSLFASSEYV